MAEIALESLTKVYPDGTHAVTELDLEVRSGEFVVFVGPSGCGKTTALRMIAGLETITSGQVTLDGQVINDLPPKERDIAMVFQNYALYPHMVMMLRPKRRATRRRVTDWASARPVHRIDSSCSRWSRARS